jgi:hypothetical protein
LLKYKVNNFIYILNKYYTDFDVRTMTLNNLITHVELKQVFS